MFSAGSILTIFIGYIGPLLPVFRIFTGPDAPEDQNFFSEKKFGSKKSEGFDLTGFFLGTFSSRKCKSTSESPGWRQE